MSARFWPLATVVFGLATIVVLVAFSMLPEVNAAYPDNSFGPALSAFQRATSMRELDALFGDPPDPGKLAAMTAGNTLDLYGFVPAYTLALIAAAALLAGGLTRPLSLAAVAAVLIGAGADIFETWTQLRMTADWTLAQVLLPGVAPAAWTKYFALAAHAALCTLICFTGERKRWLVGMIGFVPVAGVFADFAGAVHIPSLMTMVFGAHWLALLVVGVTELVRAQGASA